MRKKLLALLLAAALALSLLAGCGGGKNQSLAQIILNLLDNQYTNVTVEIDPDLEAALRKAVSQAETKEEIRAALEEILGPGINFRLLGDGQKGDTAWNLILYPGSDPDAAGRSAFAEWNKVFAFLPKDGQYGTKIAMIETENGYALLVQATVDRAGSRDDDDDEPDEPEGPGYTKTDDNSYTITSPDGLQNLFTSEWAEASNATITLPAGNYNISSTFGSEGDPFLGTLTGQKGSTTITITGSSNGLFGWIGERGKGPDNNGAVENITFDVQTNIKNTYTRIEANAKYIYAGAVAGMNCGEITGCTVTGGTIISANKDDSASTSWNYAGGIAGYNGTGGTITGCTVTGCTITGANFAGGLVGVNNGIINDSCEVKNTGVSADADADARAGGLVGWNAGDNAKVTGTYSGTGTITATATGANSNAHAGGLVGYNSSTVTGRYSGSSAITATAEGTTNSYAYAGGLVGYNLADADDVSAIYSGENTVKIEAKAKKEDGTGYYTASVPTTNGSNTDKDPDSGTIHASAGTKWGSDSIGQPAAYTTTSP